MDKEEEVRTSLQLYSHRITRKSSLRYDLHCHSFFEIYYVVCGELQSLVVGNPYVPRQSRVLRIPAGAVHGVRIDSDAPYERYALHFLPELLSPEYRETLLIPFRPGGLFLEDPGTGFRDRCASLLASGTLPEPLKSAAVKSRLEALLTELCAVEYASRTDRGAEVSHPVQGILNYVNQHLTEDLSLKHLCEQFFLSKNQLNLLFHRATGTTVWNYLLHKRAALAQQLLRQGISASEAASRAGFRDYSAFYRCYRNIYGSSPAEAKRSGFFTPSADAPSSRHTSSDRPGR